MPAAKIEYSARARREIAELDLNCIIHRPDNPSLFEEEMMKAEEYLLQTPEGLEVRTRREGLELRRYLLPVTQNHVIYHYEKSTKTVQVVAVRGAVKKPDPQLDVDELETED